MFLAVSESPTVNANTESTPWYAWFIIVVLALSAAVTLSLSAGAVTRASLHNNRHADGIAEISIRTLRAQLNVTQPNMADSLCAQEVLREFAHARALIQALQTGGTVAGQSYVVVKDSLLQRYLMVIDSLVHINENMVRELRIPTAESIVAGSILNVGHDSLSDALEKASNGFRIRLHECIDTEYRFFRTVQRVLIVLLLALAVMVAMLLGQFLRHRSRTITRLANLNAQLDAGNQQLKASEQQLKAANQQLLASDQQLRAANQQLTAHEQQLRAANVELERFRLLIDESTDAVFIADPENGKITDVNAAVCRHTGFSRPELLESAMDTVVHVVCEGGWHDCIEKLRSQHSIVMEYTQHRKDATSYPAEISVRYVDIPGQRPYIVAFSRDITERVKAMARDLESRRMWQTTFDAISTGICLLDNNKMILQFNRAMMELTGHPIEALTGSLCCETLHGDEPMIECPVDRMFLSRHREQSVISWQGRWMEVSADPVLDENGTVIGAVHVLEDITQRRRAEEESQRAQRVEALGVLAGGIAHDFNNLLSGVFGFIDLALHQSGETKIQEYLRNAMLAYTRARELTQRLLTFSKGGAPNRSIVALPQLTKDAITLGMSGSNHQCHFESECDIWPVEADVGQITQVMSNLLINARQAMPDGGRITVSLSNRMIGTGEIPGLPPGRYVQFRVSDSGVGIPPNYLNRIFDPFFSTKADGHGLGLATSHSIVTRHGGHISVESSSGSGSTFSVLLPSCVAGVPSPVPNPTREIMVQGQGRILVMDDEAIIRTMATSMLSRLGYTVECVSNGTEALERYQRELSQGHRYFAVILDLTIPGAMGGAEAMKRLREIDPAVIGIVSSGYSDDPVIADPASHGFAASVAKPYTTAEVSRVLAGLLKKPGDVLPPTS